jgi:Arc/MetJ-type ribon-helix-helix transcriptional regulator
MKKDNLVATSKSKVADSEKITINLGFVDLGQIDLLVAEGFYGNRTDFIRTAIRNHLSTHSDAVKQVVSRKMLVLGLQHFSAADLQAVQAANQKLHIRVLGLVTFADDITPELALATIDSLDVLGSLQASPAVKAALATRHL